MLLNISISGTDWFGLAAGAVFDGSHGVTEPALDCVPFGKTPLAGNLSILNLESKLPEV